MKKRKVWTALAVSMAMMLLVGLSSCSTKQHAINQLENFSEELRDNSARYNVAEYKEGKMVLRKVSRLARSS